MVVMFEKDIDGFVAVLEEKDLEHLAEIRVQQSATDIPVLLIKKNSEVFALVNQCGHNGGILAGWDGNYSVGCGRNACAGLCFDIRTGKNLISPDLPYEIKKLDCKIKEGKIWVRLV
jgi:nitrite reductase/ring-hydroxylating ferredoxin subunit